MIEENLLSTDYSDQRDRLVRALKAGKNCAIFEIQLLSPSIRDEFLRQLQAAVGEFQVEWLLPGE